MSDRGDWLTESTVPATAESVTHPQAADFIGTLLCLPPDVAEFREVRAFRDFPDAVVVVAEVGVERPQVRDLDIRSRERIGVLFGERDLPPTVLALRPDFPDTPHQNFVPEGIPSALCVDDRPWPEAKLGFSSYDFVNRIRTWLGRAARGELVDGAQPADPFFLSTHGTLIVPDDLLSGAGTHHVGAVRLTEDAAPHRVYHVADDARENRAKLMITAVRGEPRPMAKLRRAPSTLQGLHAALEPFGIDLLSAVREEVKSCAGMAPTEKARLAGLFAILVELPITDNDGLAIGLERRAFFATDTLGRVGEAIGMLLPGSSGAEGAYLTLLMPDKAKTGADVGIEMMQVHSTVSRGLLARASGRSRADDREALMVGAGSLGSQVAATLCREGAFKWTVVDDDLLMPHNVARHALLPFNVGHPKSRALAEMLRHLSGGAADAARAIAADYLHPGDAAAELRAALNRASLVVDCSASLAVARALSDDATPARRLSLFFNPSGTAGVLLAEDVARTVTLRDLEAQYYRIVMREPGLAGHLSAASGLSYSGSCRTLSAKIPQHRAGLLSAVLAGEARESVDRDGASIDIWTIGERSSVARFPAEVRSVRRFGLAKGWSLSIDECSLREIHDARRAAHPSETGGVLVGIADFLDRSVRVVDVVGPPIDSDGSPREFLRGTRDLPETMERVGAATAHQVRYVGEWHTHPPGVSSMPSGIDLEQLLGLRSHLVVEGIPPVMLIAGEDGPSVLSAS